MSCPVRSGYILILLFSVFIGLLSMTRFLSRMESDAFITFHSNLSLIRDEISEAYLRAMQYHHC